MWYFCERHLTDKVRFSQELKKLLSVHKPTWERSNYSSQIKKYSIAAGRWLVTSLFVCYILTSYWNLPPGVYQVIYIHQRAIYLSSVLYVISKVFCYQTKTNRSSSKNMTLWFIFSL